MYFLVTWQRTVYQLVHKLDDYSNIWGLGKSWVSFIGYDPEFEM